MKVDLMFGEPYDRDTSTRLAHLLTDQIRQLFFLCHVSMAKKKNNSKDNEKANLAKLSKNDISFLVDQTKYNRQEIK